MMVWVWVCVALAAHTLHGIARALSRAAERLALALDDVRATTLSLASGRVDRRTPSGERRSYDGSFHNEYHQHYHAPSTERQQ